MASRNVLSSATLVLGAAIVALGAAGCELIGGFETFETAGGGGAPTTSSTSTTSTTSTGETGGGGMSPCAAPTAGDEGMASVHGHDGCFWIDKLEVTRAAYCAFAATADASSDVSECAGANDSFDPSCAGGPGSVDCSAIGDGTLPITCVDWCDAAAFCNAAGKRLCAGPSSGSSIGDEWYFACSAGGHVSYPYGGGYDGSKCNGYDAGVGAPAPVGSFDGCVTGDGVGDLSGNVAEWTNECTNTLPTAGCNFHGGSYSDTSGLACDVIASRARLEALPSLGFRCCADPAH